MSRTWKQLAFGSIYLFIFLLIVIGAYFLYLKPAPACTDNKQNQEETGVDCGGQCIPCEVKELQPIVEELKFFPAGPDKTTFLAKVSNPSENFIAEFSYEFQLEGGLPGGRQLKGKATVAPQASEYIVVPGLSIAPQGIRSINLEISGLDWREPDSLPPEVGLTSQTDADQSRVTVSGVLSNRSAVNLASLTLVAILYDKEGQILNASLTRLEGVAAFSQRGFLIFFPEIPGLVGELDPERTKVEWDLDEKNP